MLIFGVVGYLMKKLRYEVASVDSGLCARAHAGVFAETIPYGIQGQFQDLFLPPDLGHLPDYSLDPGGPSHNPEAS